MNSLNSLNLLTEIFVIFDYYIQQETQKYVDLKMCANFNFTDAFEIPKLKTSL